jgi:capsular polysaccharide biosynthesis protein
MELIDYRGVLRRWSVLIIAGTLVAALIGYRIALRSREATHPFYVGTARVVVNYVTPPGAPYIPTLSLHTQTEVLSARVHDPGVLSRVAARAHVALSQVQRVSTAVDPQKPLITIQVLGTTPRAAATVAQGLAQYLAGVQTQQVQAQVARLSRTAASAMAQVQQRWREVQRHYYLVCGCLASQHQAQPSRPPTAQRPARPVSERPSPQPSRQPPPRTRRPPQQPSSQPADPATLAQLRAELDLLQADYATATSRYTALRNNPVPVATVLPGSVSAVRAPAASPVKAVLLAAVVGLVLSSGLAMLLDYRRSGPHALARARGPGHAASPLPDPLLAGAQGGSGSARKAHAARRDPEPVDTLTPGSARPLKAMLLAVGLGLLACIGLAALLLDGRPVPLSVASHGGARRVRLEERRWPQAVQPTGPRAALPAPPALLLNPNAVHFDRHDGPTRRTAHTIHVVNVGPAPVTIRSITITGADRAAFAEADTCTRSTVGVYGRCTISVRVAPLAGGGPRKATLLITANAPGSPQRVPLSA